MINLNKNIVRNDSPVGLSWLVNCSLQGSLRISLAFLNLIVLSLLNAWYNNKDLFNESSSSTPDVSSITGVFLSSSHGANLSIKIPNQQFDFYRSSVAFFITTTLPSVLWLSRSPKKGRNFSKQTVIGSGRINSAQNVAGVWGVCWHGATLFHSKHYKLTNNHGNSKN